MRKSELVIAHYFIELSPGDNIFLKMKRPIWNSWITVNGMVPKSSMNTVSILHSYEDQLLRAAALILCEGYHWADLLLPICLNMPLAFF